MAAKQAAREGPCLPCAPPPPTPLHTGMRRSRARLAPVERIKRARRAVLVQDLPPGCNPNAMKVAGAVADSYLYVVSSGLEGPPRWAMARRAWRPVELPPVEGSGTRGGSGLPYSPGVGGGAASQRAGGGGGRVNHLLARRAAAAEPSSERSSLASEGNHRRSGLSTRPVTSPVRGLSERERAHPLTRRLRRVGADTKGRAQKKVTKGFGNQIFQALSLP